MHRPHDISFRQWYQLRVLSAVAVCLLMGIGLVRLWPASPSDVGRLPAVDHPGELIQIEEIRPTRQSSTTPPPPAPPLPVVVADDVILEQDELDLTDNFLPIEEPAAQAAPDLEGERAEVFEGPKPIRVVEPEYTRAAHRRRVRAEVIVGVRVDDQGRVQEAWVKQRFLLGSGDEPPREVDALGYGLEEAAMAAAERCLFRPARLNGRPVESETTLGFGFGV